MRILKMSVGEHDYGKVEQVDGTWDELKNKFFLKHTIRKTKGGPFYVGGIFKNNLRRTENLIGADLITLDIDDCGGNSLFDIYLALSALCFDFVLYSTYSHEPDGVGKCRIIIPTSRTLSSDEYKIVVASLDETLFFEMGINVDPASKSAVQFFYTPCASDTGVAELFSCVSIEGETSYIKIDDYITPRNNDGDNLINIVRNRPLDISHDHVLKILANYPAYDDYHDWLEVGAALNHQYGFSDRGLETWKNWSKCSEKYDEDIIDKKWLSFGNSSNPKTFATIIKKAKKFVEIEKTTNLENLLRNAKDIRSLEQYETFKKNLTSTPEILLPSDHRALIAHELVTSFGKNSGLTKGDIKSAIAPKKNKKTDMPEWLDGWVYVESACEFHNILGNYGIKREAFNARFDREIECIVSEKSASVLALVEHRIPTVVDKMFWPGNDRFFEYEDKKLLNTYMPRGVTPILNGDFESSAVKVFLKHVDFLIENEEEKEIIIDWITYVYKNPGERVNWAVLLQGPQGIGKTYFVELLCELMGTNVGNLDPRALSERFTGWAHGKLVNAVEEIRINGKNKYEVLDRMKPFITNDSIMIEEKGRDHRTVRNFTSYFLLTNHIDAIPLTSDDRRYCVIFSRIQTEDQLYLELGGRDGATLYFDSLFSNLKSGAGELAKWFEIRETSKNFNPKGRAPITSAGAKMRDLAVSQGASDIDDYLSEYECDVINDRLIDVTTLNEKCLLDGKIIPSGRALSSILLAAGYMQISGRKLKNPLTRKNHYVWVSRKSNDDDAREIIKNSWKN